MVFSRSGEYLGPVTRFEHWSNLRIRIVFFTSWSGYSHAIKQEDVHVVCPD